MITSTANPQVKNLIQLVKKAKVRNEQRLFVVEGIRMFREIPEGWLDRIYVSEHFMEEESHVKVLQGKNYEVLANHVLESVSDTKTPQGILCLVKMPDYTLEEVIPKENAHLLILESIQDPGNLGTMFRTGEGAGISGIIMNRTTVDVFNPKTIRSTMGSIFRVPFFVTENLQDILMQLKSRKIKLYSVHLQGSVSYEEPDYKEPTGFLIGNEGNGLSDEIARMADTYIHIPMAGKVESLNAAIAATLLMYEAARQRR